MPVLKKIVVQDFRNIVLQELEFSPNINCISGNNGEGKTNLLEAVHYLSLTKTSQGISDKYNYRHGTSAFSLSGVYEMPSGLLSKVSIKVSEGADKKVVRDDKPYQKISEHLGLLPVVMVCPADDSLVNDSGEERRRFVNSVLSQMDSEYLSDIQNYNRLLQQRNAALKSDSVDSDLIDAIDSRLDFFGTRVHDRRRAFVEEISPVVASFCKELSGGRESVGISYKSDLEKGSLYDQLRASFQRDRLLKYTTAGVQRDDFVFLMDGNPIRTTGSQGQKKSFLVSLKFAQYQIMKEAYGFPPILLLDDLFDKLDLGRTSNLLKMVAGNDFGQIFISDTSTQRLRSIVDDITSSSAFFVTEGGVFTR